MTRARDSRPARGARRSGAFSLGAIAGFLVLGYAALRALELAPRSSLAPIAEEAAEALEDPGPQGSPGWQAVVPVGSTRVLARLVPLHDEEALQRFRASALRERYRLPDGEPWRLLLSLEAATSDPGEVAVRVEGAEVSDAQGLLLRPLAALAPAPAELDPVWTLLASPPAALDVEQARPYVLWGRKPGTDARLVLRSDSDSGEAALEPVPEGLTVPRWLAGRALESDEVRSLEDEVARLKAELARERARRAEREQAFLEFSRMLSDLPQLDAASGALAAGALEPPPETAAEREQREAAETAAARAEELGRALGVLMKLEGLRGLDLLEAGALRDGAIGPIVFRCLDERGLLTGSVNAERLHLEASRAARTLTLVLEEGYESRGGERVPFENGVRRITLADVDPEAWLERCPELFSERDLAVLDDGRWSLALVRRELNRLLTLDTSNGWFRLHSLGGVRGEELLDVQIEELEESGRLRRRLFADRMELALEDGSVVLALQDGASVRGEEKQPFRDGRHRIVLAGAPLEAWRTAQLPGLNPPPERETPPAQEDR